MMLCQLLAKLFILFPSYPLYFIFLAAQAIYKIVLKNYIYVNLIVCLLSQMIEITLNTSQQ